MLIGGVKNTVQIRIRKAMYNIPNAHSVIQQVWSVSVHTDV